MPAVPKSANLGDLRPWLHFGAHSGAASRLLAKNFTRARFWGWMSPDLRSRDRQPDGLGGAALAGVGVQFAVTLVAFYYLGQWLDRRFGTAPVFLLVCVFGGAGASFYAMYSQLMAAQRREDVARRAATETARGAGQRGSGSDDRAETPR